MDKNQDAKHQDKPKGGKYPDERALQNIAIQEDINVARKDRERRGCYLLIFNIVLVAVVLKFGVPLLIGFLAVIGISLHIDVLWFRIVTAVVVLMVVRWAMRTLKL